MTLKLDVFDDFHVHGASAPEWNQRYLQVSRGTMHSSLAEVTADSLHVFRKWMSERVIQQGGLPEGQDLLRDAARSVRRDAPHAGARGARGQRHRSSRRRRVHPAAPPRHGAGGGDVRARRLRRLLDERPWPTAARALLRARCCGPGPALQRLRHDLLSLFEAPRRLRPRLGEAEARPAGDSGAFEALRELFRAPPTRARRSAAPRRASSSRNAIASSRRAAMPQPSVAELCQRLRTSRRTLQDSFRQVADTTPVHYLRCVG